MGKKPNLFQIVDAAQEAAKTAERIASQARKTKRQERAMRILKIIGDILSLGLSIGLRFAVAKVKNKNNAQPPEGVA